MLAFHQRFDFLERLLLVERQLLDLLLHCIPVLRHDENVMFPI